MELKNIVIATFGRFKDGRGEFSLQSLDEIARLMQLQPAGLKVRFGHVSPFSDSLDRILGRAKNVRVLRTNFPPRVVADLHFNPASKIAPGPADLETYVKTLAESDPSNAGFSLEGDFRKKEQTDRKGKPLVDSPPIWFPVSLSAVALCDEANANDSMTYSFSIQKHSRRLAVPDRHRRRLIGR